MDEYKKLLKSKYLRFAILRVLRFIPDKQMLELQYRIKFKRKLNLKNPQRFMDKIQWYKLNYKNSLMPLCADKYTARQYVEAKGLGSILNELYCVFDNPDSIDLSKLPQKFVLKLSNGSGTNYVCRDKSRANESEIKALFKRFQFMVKANSGREWPYLEAKSVIVAEKLLEDSEHFNNAINDYKIFCYNGQPKYIICVSDRYSSHCNHLVYDCNWNKINAVSEGAILETNAPRPENLPEMLEIARILSEEFPFARIDLYSIQGKIYFGEITFYPWSGYMEYEPDSFDFELGRPFIIPFVNEDRAACLR